MQRQATRNGTATVFNGFLEMSQIVTCPCGCNHSFEIREEFEEYEEMVAKIVGGKTMPPRTPGYDVIDPDGFTYQVKYTGCPIKDPRYKCEHWYWQFSNGHKLTADFLVLFAKDRSGNLSIFLMNKVTCKTFSPVGHDRFIMTGGIGKRSKIWDHRVSAENFMARVSELKKIEQLSLQFTQGLGSS